MSLVGNYSTQFLHNFHPHLLQTLNHGMLAANGAAAAAAAAGAPGGYFASERSPLGKPSVLSNFSLPSAFSPPKYIGISLDQVRQREKERERDRLAVVITEIEFGFCFCLLLLLQNLFNGNESFRTDSASPTCTSHESMEGSQDYDAVEKGESPRSNNSQDPRDLRRKLGLYLAWAFTPHSALYLIFANLHVTKIFADKKKRKKKQQMWAGLCLFLIRI